MKEIMYTGFFHEKSVLASSNKKPIKICQYVMPTSNREPLRWFWQTRRPSRGVTGRPHPPQLKQSSNRKPTQTITILPSHKCHPSSHGCSGKSWKKLIPLTTAGQIRRQRWLETTGKSTYSFMDWTPITMKKVTKNIIEVKATGTRALQTNINVFGFNFPASIWLLRSLNL